MEPALLALMILMLISRFDLLEVSSAGAEHHRSFNWQMGWSLEVQRSHIAPSNSSKSRPSCWALWI